MQTEMQVVDKLPRATMIELLVERDGAVCMYPGCGRKLDFTIDYASLDLDDPRCKFEPTIDHWMPRSYLISIGYSWEQIWDLENLRLMEKRCNAKKGDRIPNEDGTLPDRPASKFRYRRQKRVGRPDICATCNAGRDLAKGEICSACQHGAAPLRFPRWAKVSSSECDHEAFWCWACSIGIVERPSAEQMIYLWGEGGE